MKTEASKSISTHAFFSALGVISSRITGVVREFVLAFIFGASPLMDAFNIAFRIPNLLRDVLAEGALSQSFVPAFSQSFIVEEERAYSLAKRFLISQLILLVVICGIGYFCSSFLVESVTSSKTTAETVELAQSMTKLLWGFLFFVSLSAFLQGMHQSTDKFFKASASSSMLNVGSVLLPIGAYLLFDSKKEQIWSVPWGFVFGAFLQTVYLARGAFKKILFARLELSTSSQVWSIYKLLLTGSLGLLATQVNVFISTYYASSLEAGSLSQQAYAFRIILVPLGLIGVSYSVASLPSVSRFVATEPERFGKFFEFGFIQLALFSIPLSLFCFMESYDIISLFYYRGAFSRIDWIRCSEVLQIYSLGLGTLIFLKFVTPNFYAFKKVWVPIITSTLSVILTFIILHTCIDLFDIRTLPMAVVVSSFCALCIQMAFLSNWGIAWKSLLKKFFLVLLFSIPLAAMLYFIKNANLHYSIRLSVAGLAFGIYFFGILKLYPYEEGKEIYNKLTRKFRA